jgi:hypothetical protein
MAKSTSGQQYTLTPQQEREIYQQGVNSVDPDENITVQRKAGQAAVGAEKAKMKFQEGGLVPPQRQPGDIQAVSFGMPQPSPISERVNAANPNGLPFAGNIGGPQPAPQFGPPMGSTTSSVEPDYTGFVRRMGPQGFEGPKLGSLDLTAAAPPPGGLLTGSFGPGGGQPYAPINAVGPLGSATSYFQEPSLSQGSPDPSLENFAAYYGATGKLPSSNAFNSSYLSELQNLDLDYLNSLRYNEISELRFPNDSNQGNILRIEDPSGNVVTKDLTPAQISYLKGREQKRISDLQGQFQSVSQGLMYPEGTAPENVETYEEFINRTVGQRPFIGDDFIVPRGGFPWGDDIGKLPDRGDDIGKLPDINNFVNAMSDEERRNWAQNRSIQRDVKSPEEQALIDSILQGGYAPASPQQPTDFKDQVSGLPAYGEREIEYKEQEIFRPVENEFERFNVNTDQFNTYASRVYGQQSGGGELAYDANNPSGGIAGSPSAMTGVNANTVRAMLRIYDQYQSLSGDASAKPKIAVAYKPNSNEFTLKVNGQAVGDFANDETGMSQAGQALIGQLSTEYTPLQGVEEISTGETRQVATYPGQQIIAGQPQGPEEINIMDYYGAQASAPVLQPELQLATQIQKQQVQPGEIQIAPTMGTAPTVSASRLGTAIVGQPTAQQAATGQVTLAETAGRPDLAMTEAALTGGTIPTTTAAQGTVSQDAQVQAAQGGLSEGALAETPEYDDKYTDLVDPAKRTVNTQELAVAAGKKAEAIRTDIAQSDALANAVAEQGYVRPEEIPTAAKIAEGDMARAEAIVADRVAQDAIAIAEKLDKFTLDAGTLAKFEQGEVNAKATVQGQLEQLMKSFDDGTPAWAAGAIRSANAAMASRGLGASSMAGAAILQAAMESALPIASQDAQTYAQMGLANLNNKTQVSLANAAAQQGVELANFNARQQTALQNSTNAFALQMENLSNTQQTVLANAQIKAALQGQNLSNEQQANLVTAARYAESANINLSNAQQTALQNNTNQLQTNLANLSAKQQAYVTNANLAASLQGQVIANEQQVAIANAARFAEANNLTFNAEQQAQLHNSSLMQSIGLANLSAKQATTLQNAATLASMDMANLDNRQQAAVVNAQSFLQMDMANLSNDQQALMFDAQARIQSIFNDQAAQNTANNINAQSENELNRYFTELATQVNVSNAAQTNAMSQFNATAENQNMQFFEELGLQADKINADAINDMTEFSAEQVLNAAQFNANMKNNREQFQINNQIAIDANNIQWRRDVNTANTATINAAINQDVQNLFGIQQNSLNNIWDHFDQMVGFAFEAEEGALNRAVNLAIASMNADLQKQIAESESDSSLISGIFNAGARFLGTDTGAGIVKEFLGL